MQHEVPIESLSFFKRLTADQQERFLAETTTTVFPGGQEVWFETMTAERFQIVLSGQVKLTRMDAEGRETIICLRPKGTFICPMQPYARSSYCCSATTVGSTRVLTIDRRLLVTFLGENASAALNFIDSMVDHGKSLCDRIDEVSAPRVVQRLARMFIRMAETFGQRTPEGAVLIPVRLTRQDLADLCATTPETVSRQLTLPHVAALVRTHSHGFTLSSLSRLRDVADGMVS